jgi:hypothetical protein
MFASISSNSTYKWVNKRCWANKWYYLWCLLPSRTYIVTPRQSRIVKGIHGLLKVSPGSALPDPSMPCGRATPKMALQPFKGWLACRRVACSRLLSPWTHHTVWGFPTVYCSHSSVHGRIARSIHGLPKVLLGPTMLYPSTPCGQANSKKALQPFQEWSSLKAGSLWSSFTPLETRCHTPMHLWAKVNKNWIKTY